MTGGMDQETIYLKDFTDDEYGKKIGYDRDVGDISDGSIHTFNKKRVRGNELQSESDRKLLASEGDQDSAINDEINGFKNLRTYRDIEGEEMADYDLVDED